MNELQSVLNRLAAFGFTNEVEARRSVSELQFLSQCVTAHSFQFSEELMSQCIDLLEELPKTSPALGALVMLLANACLVDENQSLASRFGLSALCVVVLQSHAELSNETLFYVFDLMSTLSSRVGFCRECLRPGIPYVLVVMESRFKSLDVLFSGCFLLSILTMLDDSNCELVVHQGGMQVLVNAYRHALQYLSESTQKQPKATEGIKTTPKGILSEVRKTKRLEDLDLCKGILRWAKSALQNLCRARIRIVEEALAALNFGRYGASIEMDELKWALVFERKRKK